MSGRTASGCRCDHERRHGRATARETWLDGSLRGFGAGAGNAQSEVMCAAFERAGQ
jgi:hypothetical protein